MFRTSEEYIYDNYSSLLQRQKCHCVFQVIYHLIKETSRYRLSPFYIVSYTPWDICSVYYESNADRRSAWCIEPTLFWIFLKKYSCFVDTSALPMGFLLDSHLHKLMINYSMIKLPPHIPCTFLCYKLHRTTQNVTGDREQTNVKISPPSARKWRSSFRTNAATDTTQIIVKLNIVVRNVVANLYSCFNARR